MRLSRWFHTSAKNTAACQLNDPAGQRVGAPGFQRLLEDLAAVVGEAVALALAVGACAHQEAVLVLDHGQLLVHQPLDVLVDDSVKDAHFSIL
jgi:hypothetical protein